jgi:hypothetical protein
MMITDDASFHGIMLTFIETLLSKVKQPNLVLSQEMQGLE